MILDALFVIWITWQVAPKGRPGGGCWERGREIIPRDSIYACLNVFDCALLIQIKLNSDSTSGCLHCCCCFVVVLFSCGKLSLGPERTSISHFPASPCCCFLLVVLVVVVQLQPHYNTFALCASQLNLRLLWAVEGGKGKGINFSDSLRLLALIKSVQAVCRPPRRICN